MVLPSDLGEREIAKLEQSLPANHPELEKLRAVFKRTAGRQLSSGSLMGLGPSWVIMSMLNLWS